MVRGFKGQQPGDRPFSLPVLYPYCELTRRTSRLFCQSMSASFCTPVAGRHCWTRYDGHWYSWRKITQTTKGDPIVARPDPRVGIINCLGEVETNGTTGHPTLAFFLEASWSSFNRSSPAWAAMKKGGPIRTVQ